MVLQTDSHGIEGIWGAGPVRHDCFSATMVLQELNNKTDWVLNSSMNMRE